MTVTQKGIVIRYAEAQDWPEFFRLVKLMHAESRFAKYPLIEERMRKVFDDHLQHLNIACCLLAVNKDQQIVGMLMGYVIELFFADERVAQDRLFFVQPVSRGSSAAVRLLSAFRAWAQKRGAQEVSINMSVAVDMSRFNRFMTHMGFACCGSNFYHPLQSS